MKDATVRRTLPPKDVNDLIFRHFCPVYEASMPAHSSAVSAPIDHRDVEIIPFLPEDPLVAGLGELGIEDPLIKQPALVTYQNPRSLLGLLGLAG